MSRGAGAKSEILTVQRASPRTRRAGGGYDVTWTDIGQIYAEARYVRAGEQQRQGAVRELSVYRFLVLSAAVTAMSITSKDRLVWNGEVYNIREQPRRLPRAIETEILAEAGVAQ
jgi:head-tail adaptor